MYDFIVPRKDNLWLRLYVTNATTDRRYFGETQIWNSARSISNLYN